MSKEDVKWLKWSNGKEYGEINCPMFGNEPVMTYWGGGPCYDSYTAPFVMDEEIYCYRYDHDMGGWHEDDLIFLGAYDGDETWAFG